MRYLGKFLKKYLAWAGFDLKEQKARFVIRLFFDFIAAVVYSGVSIWLIIVQQADLVVLGLNILCLLRAVISSTISASEVTNKSKNIDIESNCEKNSHYHKKAEFLAITFFYATMVWAALLYEGNESSILIKLFASLAIGTVLINDIENMIACAYNATVELVKN